MTTFARHPATLLVALMLALATLAGCSETPQEKYDNAVKKLQQARESRNDAQDKVDSRQEELEKAQDRLNDAQDKLKQARNKVEAASAAVNKTVSDEVLFRSIQRDVLDKKDFDKAAISVGVKNRVVTLTGHVPDEDTHERALELARQQAGVADVVDELKVGDNDNSAPASTSDRPDESDQPNQSDQSDQGTQSVEPGPPAKEKAPSGAQGDDGGSSQPPAQNSKQDANKAADDDAGAAPPDANAQSDQANKQSAPPLREN